MGYADELFFFLIIKILEIWNRVLRDINVYSANTCCYANVYAMYTNTYTRNGSLCKKKKKKLSLV